jgi:hypothetical protein
MPDKQKPVEGVEVTEPIIVKVKGGTVSGEKRGKASPEGEPEGDGK